MAINQPVAGLLQDPSPAALAAAAEAAAANTATMRALRPLPRVRGVSLRWVAGSGGAPRVYWGICLEARAPNAEAALVQSRGTVASQPYRSCVRGSGLLMEYIRVAGQLRGSYANCYYGSKGARCSF